jgi:hypothetical protein
MSNMCIYIYRDDHLFVYEYDIRKKAHVITLLFFVQKRRKKNTKHRGLLISQVAPACLLLPLPTISPRGANHLPEPPNSAPRARIPRAAHRFPPPAPCRGGRETAAVPIGVDCGQGRPKSPRHRSHGPGHHGRDGPRHQHRSRPPPPPLTEFRPFRRWFPFLVPLFIVANIVLFVLTMYINDCPAHAQATGAAIGGSVGESATAQGCWLAPELGRFAFQSFKENPLVGPSSAT